jgi:CRISPR type III-A-associated RAMP protein Csm4
MNPGLLVKLRPTGPWRIGPDSGARNRVDAVYHSDSLYAAVCSAMTRLGMLEEWLDATARSAGPAVAFSSCFPFLEEIRFIAPPRSIWPPTAPALLAARVRWKSARFVPLAVAEMLLAGQTLEENQWTVDGPSECLAPASTFAGPGGPFRTSVRWNAAVDRLSGYTERHSTACLEFRPGAGLWCAAAFADEAAREKWMEPVKAAFRWLADAGFGGERSRGWGRSAPPEFTEGPLRDMILTRAPAAAKAAAPSEEPAAEGVPEAAVEAAPEPEAPAAPHSNGLRPHWLLSLFTPAEGDAVDWSRGSYTLMARAGRVEGSGELKKNLQMVAEGSVIYAPDAPRGAAPDVAPEGSPHPVFRAGFAVSIPLTEGV